MINLLTKLNNLNLVQNYRKILPYVKPYWVQAMIAILIAIPSYRKWGVFAVDNERRPPSPFLGKNFGRNDLT